MYGKEVGIAAYILYIERVETALTKRKIVYGIQQVGLTNAIVADKTIDAGREGDIHLLIVLEVS
jgi:hypothetical protein